MDILPDDEREAVEFIWVNEGHQKTSFDKIPASDQERLRRAVELRKEQIETHVLHDMLVTYPRLGHQLRIASPPQPQYQPPKPVWDRVVELGCDKHIFWSSDPREAVKNADVVITDTWYAAPPRFPWSRAHLPSPM